jgi:hypothetical protein
MSGTGETAQADAAVFSYGPDAREKARTKMSVTQSLNTYHVRVGLAECTVSCGSKNEAVKMAREELRQQMPHMGTIIQGIRENEFRVDQVHRKKYPS